jgi:asparagine synthase (glutamine-hydrolysing)
VKLDQSEFERSLPGIVERLEEPIAASSIVPMYFVSQRARQDVKVALIGQGPDELFGGYKRHLGVHYGEWWRGLPTSLRSVIGRAVNGLPRSEMLKRGVYSLNTQDRLRRYQDVFSIAPQETIDGFFREGVLPERDGQDLVEYWDALRPQMEQTDELGGFQLLEIRSSLPDELLMYADKLSMAHSLEVRVPYLDRTVVEYVQRLSANFKVRNATRKWLHRILRRKKRGFAVNVVDDWFRSSLGSEIADILLNESALIFDLLDPKSARRLLKDHQSGRQNNHKLLFSLVMLEQWLRAKQHRESRAKTESSQDGFHVHLTSSAK